MKMLKIVSLAIVICFAACRSFVTTTLEADLFEETLNQFPNPQLVDVRTPKEFNEGYIPGAINIDIKSVAFDSLILHLNKEQPVFVYCLGGKRSLQAANILEKNKFKVVYNLDGGITAWKAKGKAIVLPAKEN